MNKQSSKTRVLFESSQGVPQLRFTEATQITQAEMLRPAPPASSLASSLIEVASQGVKMLENEKVRPTYTRNNGAECHEINRQEQDGAGSSGRRRLRGDMESTAREIIYGEDPSQWAKLKKDLAGRGLLTHYGIKASLGEVLEQRVGEKLIALELDELPSEEKESRGHPLARFYYGNGDDDTNQTEQSSGLSSFASLGDERTEPLSSVPTLGGIISFVGDCAKKVCTAQDSCCATPTNSWRSARPKNTPLRSGLEGMGDDELDELIDVLEKAVKLGS